MGRTWNGLTRFDGVPLYQFYRSTPLSSPTTRRQCRGRPSRVFDQYYTDRSLRTRMRLTLEHTGELGILPGDHLIPRRRVNSSQLPGRFVACRPLDFKGAAAGRRSPPGA